MATKFGGKNPWPERNALLGSKVIHGSARVNQRSNSLEMPCGHQNSKKGPLDQSVMHWWGQKSRKGQLGSTRSKLFRNAMWLPGVIRVQPEGNCLEMHRAIKCRKSDRALCSCRCSSIFKMKTGQSSNLKTITTFNRKVNRINGRPSTWRLCSYFISRWVFKLTWLMESILQTRST